MPGSISSQEAARRLGISSDDIAKLVNQEILRPTQKTPAGYLFATTDIERIASNREPTISDEAAQVGVQIQQEVVYSVSALQRLRRRLMILTGLTAAGLLLSVALVTTMFRLYPSQTSDFFGYYYKFNSGGKDAVFRTGPDDFNMVAAVEPVAANTNTNISLAASLTKPIAAMSLLIVKATDGQQYKQIVEVPSYGSGARGLPGRSGQPGTQGLSGQPGTAGLNGRDGAGGQSGANGRNGANGQNGVNGISVADVATTAGDIVIRDAGNVPARLGAGSAGQVLTINGGVPAWMNSTGLTAEADTLASVTNRGASTDSALTLSSSANDFTLGTLRLNGEVITDLSGSGLAVMGTDLNVAGLTNANLSGSAEISNANLENSSVAIDTIGPLDGGGIVSLGGPGLMLSCATCLTGASNIFYVSPASGSGFTIMPGDTFSLTAGLNVTTAGDGGGSVTIATSQTPAFDTVNGLTIVSNGSNSLSIANGKAFGVNNSLIFNGVDGTAFSLPSSSDTLVGRSSSDVLLNKVIAAGSNTITGLTNSNFSGSAGISNANLANSGLSLTGNTGSGSVSLGGGLTFSGGGITAVTASGSTLTVTTNEADTLASVTARGSSTSTNLTFSGGLTFSGSVTFSGLTNCHTLATNASGVLGCGDTTGDGATFTDTSPATIADNDNTELFNDVSKPRITPTFSSQTILVSVHAKFTGGGNGDTDAAVRIVRNIGSAASCSGGLQVGDDSSAFMTNSTDIQSASNTFLDSPATTSPVYYTVCSSVDSRLGSTPVSNRIDVTLIRIGR
jgi:hypothetical protein